MTTYRFERVTTRRSKSGKCPACGRRTSRSNTFEQTVNPFNKNSDGTVRTRAEVVEAVNAEADRWVPDFAHAQCVGLPA